MDDEGSAIGKTYELNIGGVGSRWCQVFGHFTTLLRQLKTFCNNLSSNYGVARSAPLYADGKIGAKAFLICAKAL